MQFGLKTADLETAEKKLKAEIQLKIMAEEDKNEKEKEIESLNKLIKSAVLEHEQTKAQYNQVIMERDNLGT